MKLKKVLALVLSAALVVSAFAGCGGNSSSSTTSTDDIVVLGYIKRSGVSRYFVISV